MINFEEEISHFKPSLEISKVEDTIVKTNMHDITEIMLELMSHKTKE